MTGISTRWKEEDFSRFLRLRLCIRVKACDRWHFEGIEVMCLLLEIFTRICPYRYYYLGIWCVNQGDNWQLKVHKWVVVIHILQLFSRVPSPQLVVLCHWYFDYLLVRRLLIAIFVYSSNSMQIWCIVRKTYTTTMGEDIKCTCSGNERLYIYMHATSVFVLYEKESHVSSQNAIAMVKHALNFAHGTNPLFSL